MSSQVLATIENSQALAQSVDIKTAMLGLIKCNAACSIIRDALEEKAVNADDNDKKGADKITTASKEIDSIIKILEKAKAKKGMNGGAIKELVAKAAKVAKRTSKLVLGDLS